MFRVVGMCVVFCCEKKLCISQNSHVPCQPVSRPSSITCHVPLPFYTARHIIRHVLQPFSDQTVLPSIPSTAMPQLCRGLQCPAGGPPRPCIFAANGKGGRNGVEGKRSGFGCAFCCPEAFDKACNSRCGKGNLTRRLKEWREKGSPVFKAAFTLGMPGLLLPLELQHKLRRMAGERPKFNKRRSWPHRKQARLQFFRRGKPIPPQPELNEVATRFLLDCENNRGRQNPKGFWVEKLRYKVREYARLRRQEPAPTKVRRKWWRLRRELQQLLLPPLAEGPPDVSAIEWAAAEGIVTVALQNPS